MDLALTPNSRLAVVDVSAERAAIAGDAPDAGASRYLGRVRRAFASSQDEGLFVLAAEKTSEPLMPAVAFWRGFAERYLRQLCHLPANEDGLCDPIAPPDDLDTVLLSAPLMLGGEYLTTDVLRETWQGLDGWVRRQSAEAPEGLSGFLRQRAAVWHQVGRVCFHLAENRRDPHYPFAFLATYTSGVAASAAVQHEPLSQALQQYAGAKNKRALIKLLSPVHLASQQSSLIKELSESGDLFQPLAWTPEQAYRFLREVPVFEDSGVVVRLPDWWKKRPRPRVNVTIGGRRPSKFDAKAMLEFQVHVALGDQPLTEAEWAALMGANDGLVLLRGQWVEVDREKLAEALDHWERVRDSAPDGMSFIEGMRLLAGASQDLTDALQGTDQEHEWSHVDAGQWLGKMLADLRNPDTLRQAQPGSDFKATLREYQKTGTNWLWFLSELGLGACLADDMGLGKTIQVLALLTVLKNKRDAKPSLLVLPASLLGNWKAEINRFAPELRSRFLHPSELSKDEMARLARDSGPSLAQADVVITTYGMLARLPRLLDRDWRLVVLDEAQAIKNPGTKQTKLVKQLRGEARIALTGTPIENQLSDLWSLFDFLCPGLLGSQARFKEFVKRLEDRREQRYAPLRALIQPYILRRLKTDRRVISDLPDKTEVRAFCGLTKKQVALYTKLVHEMTRSLEETDGIQRKGMVLAYLMRFKQLCNHPSQLLGDGRFQPEQSGKYQRLAEICEEIASRQEKVLVFTQFREMTQPLADHLATLFGRSGLVLHGGTAVKHRARLVEQFQRDDGPPFFVLSLKAAGTGLNLTAASHVIHFDRWWNPAVENQATDRAFRIGQQRNVLVHKFVCRGTVEEKVDALIAEKTELAADLLEGGPEKILTELDDQELIRLVSLDVSKACE
ncbi:MAG: DEAD/DEAH box helicase [Planctomycetes bacterium]|nr:DEAD/DEAH box helicase [Planctomycetota bacterium]